MNYAAWLPADTVTATVDVNLFDVAENRTILRKMLGLEELQADGLCGTVSEARLAFAMCRARGLGGVITADIDTADFLAEAVSTLEHYASRASLTVPTQSVGL